MSIHGEGGSVYIITNKNNTVLYVGASTNLIARIQDHIDRKYAGSFSARYSLYKLVYYQHFSSKDEAFMYEKKLKGGSRQKKINHIESINKEWNDLYEDLLIEWGYQ